MAEIPVAFILVGSLVGLGIGAYFFLMIFYPEWVGITGKNAMKTLDDHKDENTDEKSDEAAP